MRTYNSALKIENLAHLLEVLIWQRIQSRSTKDVSSYRSQVIQWNLSLKSQTSRYCKTLPVALIFLSSSFLVFPRKALRHGCTAIFVSSLINTPSSCSKLSPVFNLFGMPWWYLRLSVRNQVFTSPWTSPCPSVLPAWCQSALGFPTALSVALVPG